MTAEQGRGGDAAEVAAALFNLETDASMAHVQASGEPPVPSVLAGNHPANWENGRFVPDMQQLGKLQQYAALIVNGRKCRRTGEGYG